MAVTFSVSVGRGTRPDARSRVRVLTRTYVCVYACGHVCEGTCAYLLYIFACVCGEWRAACPCLVWLGFTRPLGNRKLDSLTAWMGRRE